MRRGGVGAGPLFFLEDFRDNISDTLLSVMSVSSKGGNTRLPAGGVGPG